MSQMPATLGLHVRDQVSGLWLAARSQMNAQDPRVAVRAGSCDVIGACCVNGICYQRTEAQCQATNGQWFGVVPCDPSPCDPIGACCINNVCVQRTQASCAASGGVFRGYIDCSTDVCPCTCGSATTGCLSYRNISTGTVRITGSGVRCVRCVESNCQPYMQQWVIDHTVQLAALVTGNTACFQTGENVFIDPVPFISASGPCGPPLQGLIRFVRVSLNQPTWRITPNFYLANNGVGQTGCTNIGLVNNVLTQVPGQCSGVSSLSGRNCPAGLSPGNVVCPGSVPCPGAESGSVSFSLQRRGTIPCGSALLELPSGLVVPRPARVTTGCASCNDQATGGLLL